MSQKKYRIYTNLIQFRVSMEEKKDVIAHGKKCTKS